MKIIQVLSLILSVAAVAAALAAETAPQPEVRNVRFHSPRLAVSRAHADSTAFIRGQLRTDMSFARATARKPILRIVCLCEVDGALVMYQGFWDRPKTYVPMGQSEISEAFKNAGVELKGKEREEAYQDLEQITKCLPEVSRDGYTAITYGANGMNSGFFRVDKRGAQVKIVVFRLELWQNGSLVASYDSPSTGTGKYELPADWHAWKRYPQKFKYVRGR